MDPSQLLQGSPTVKPKDGGEVGTVIVESGLANMEIETFSKEESRRVRRNNIGNALTNTLRQDVHISLNQVNAGTQLLQAAIIISEIPANLILQRLGPRVWLTTLLAVWGTVTLTQAWITNVHSFYATRFLLGLFEGGFIPGAQYILALFYKSDELALRTAIFYIGNYAAAGTGSLIAAGILKLDGKANLAGWRWLFINALPVRTNTKFTQS
ncbi:hypothetical protein NQ176_g11325 [Zarea fungicola]|uniref:Uncharacterized protein n=1 Tax=Zarea fungicola TaxID=93591 RepID=A0ACC1MCY6_9HYPO|nr:hypothetical protein NQ176_g11325 [Lecanicillium fungicola]